ncbi:MAG: hypothetical protein U9Q78_06765 [Chloroflexota bacterium]|nr:hypothetical protein [Chloroflexota bacterium]
MPVLAKERFRVGYPQQEVQPTIIHPFVHPAQGTRRQQAVDDQHGDHRAIGLSRGQTRGDVSMPRAIAVHDLHQADAFHVGQQKIET